MVKSVSSSDEFKTTIEEDKSESYLQMTKNKFEQFYEENKKKTCVFKDYSLNKERMKQFKELIQDEIDYQKSHRQTIKQDLGNLELFEFFSRAIKGISRYETTDKMQLFKRILKEIGGTTNNTIAFLHELSNLRYVSFDEFYNRLRKCAKELVQYLQQPKYKNTLIILRIPGAINKSNLWVTMLIYDIIGKYVHGIDYYDEDIEHIGKHIANLYRSGRYNRILYIYPDDCIYSGKQLSDKIKEVINKTVREIYYEKLDKQENYPIDKMEHYILCPYISYIFKKHRLEYLLLPGRRKTPIFLPIYHTLPKSAEIMSTFSKNIDTRFLSPRLNVFKGEVDGLSPSHANIYFQHKFADAVSLPIRVFEDGLVPYENRTKMVGTLINNCNNHGKEFACPPACYKNIEYTFKGEKINPKKYLEDIL